MHRGCVVGSVDAGQRGISLDRVRPWSGIDLWEQGLPPLLCGSGDELNTADAPQQPERRRLLQKASSGLGHVQKREPPFTVHPPNQDGDDVAGQHAVRDEGSGDDEEHPGQGHGGETDSAQKGFGHLCVHGGQSHAGQSHRDQTLGVALDAVALQEVQEAVEQARGGGEQQEREQEPHGADAFLQAATEKHQGCDVQEKLRGGSVIKGIREEPVEVSVKKNTRANAEDAFG